MDRELAAQLSQILDWVDSDEITNVQLAKIVRDLTGNTGCFLDETSNLFRMVLGQRTRDRSAMLKALNEFDAIKNALRTIADGNPGPSYAAAQRNLRLHLKPQLTR